MSIHLIIIIIDDRKRLFATLPTPLFLRKKPQSLTY